MLSVNSYINRKTPVNNNTEQINLSSYIVIVEGSDDSYLFEAIFSYLHFSKDDFGIVVAGGKDFKSVMEQISKNTNYLNNKISKILFIQDADKNENNSKKDLNNSIKKYFKIEKSNDDLNYYLTNTSVIIGSFIVSFNGKGAIEDLCLEFAKDQMKIDYDHVEKFFQNTSGNNNHILDNKKRKLQSLLSVKSEPLCNGAGMSIKNNVFEIKHEVFKPIVEYTKNFFNDFNFNEIK